MKSYEIFKHPNGDMRAIKTGWSWPACLFGLVWAICCGIWPLALGLLVLAGLVSGIATSIGGEGLAGVTYIFSVLNGLVLGAVGNSLHAKWRVRKGYARVGSCDAPNAKAALSAHGDPAEPWRAQTDPRSE